MKTNLFFCGLIIIATGSSWREPAQTFCYNYENVLGTSFEFKVKADNEQVADLAESVVLEEIDRLDLILSSYKPQSEFNRWQRTLDEDVPVSKELFEVLQLFDAWREKTGGALNAAAGVAVRLWENAAAGNDYPGKAALHDAVAEMSRVHWQLNDLTGTARHLTKQPLLLNTFVKSYIISRAADRVMQMDGVDGVVVNIGGDIVIRGDTREIVTVSDPGADAENDAPMYALQLENKAIASSGNYRRGYRINDTWVSHILDPRTGLPAQNVISATVVAGDATDAGALATVFNVLSPTESVALAEDTGVEYVIILSDGTRLQSAGWAAAQVGLPSGNFVKTGEYELDIVFELSHTDSRARRPFVAVWVEDNNRKPVRTLALWYNKPRWLPDLKRWYNRNYEALGRETVVSVSSATRSPGKYTIKWDGRDQGGNEVPKGTYTVYIEAAREHGTYQLIRQEIEWNNKPRHFDATGGVEISSASFDYHKVQGAK